MTTASNLTVDGNLVSFRVHALCIAHIVALLARVPRCAGGMGSRQASQKQAGARTDCGAAPAAKSCACCGAKSRRYGCTPDSAGHGGPVRSHAAGLLMRELPAGVIVIAELLKAPASAGQGHHAGARRHGSACRQQHC